MVNCSRRVHHIFIISYYIHSIAKYPLSGGIILDALKWGHHFWKNESPPWELSKNRPWYTRFFMFLFGEKNWRKPNFSQKVNGHWLPATSFFTESPAPHKASVHAGLSLVGKGYQKIVWKNQQYDQRITPTYPKHTKFGAFESPAVLLHFSFWRCVAEIKNSQAVDTFSRVKNATFDRNPPKDRPHPLSGGIILWKLFFFKWVGFEWNRFLEIFQPLPMIFGVACPLKRPHKNINYFFLSFSRQRAL